MKISNSAGFRKVDMEIWPRREHYKYYTEILKIEYNVTADVQVDNLLEFCHRTGHKFYPAFICLVTKTVNSLENFLMFKNPSGELCLWDYRVPSYTIFHDDDKTFSDCWSEYSEDFERLYQSVVDDMNRFKHTKGIKVRPNQPANFFCISCAPWTRFTGFSSRVTNGEPQFFPIITGGKYEQSNGKTLMPVSLMIAHAVCDGYHTGLFFQTLQDGIDKLK